MAIDFPNTPTNGDSYVAGGKTWIYNSATNSWAAIYPHAATHASTGFDPVTLAQSQITNLTSDLALKAPLDGPTFSGTVSLPSTTSIGNVSSTEIAFIDGVTSAVQTQLNAKAPLASPALTGTPTSTTAAANTNSTQIATTAYVVGQAASSTPLVDGTAAIGTSLRYARQDHVHPTDTSRAPTASPTFTGTVTTPLTTAGYVTTTAGGVLGSASLGTNVATFLATPSSANLASALTDETGTGVNVFGTGPTISLPIINNLKLGYTTTATAAGTTTLTVDSNANQFFTGTNTQIVTLPLTSTLTLGMQYRITNASTGTVTVRSSGAVDVYAQGAGETVVYTCILTSGTTNTSWYYEVVSGAATAEAISPLMLIGA